MTAIALLGISYSNNFIMLCSFAIPLGLGAGCVDAALNNYVALHYKASHMSWLHCFWGLGATLGPIILSYWLTKGRWNMGYRTISFFQIALVAVLFISLPLWKKVEGRLADSSENKIEHKALSIKEMIKLPGVKAALASFFCYCAIETTTGLWGSSFLVKARGIDTKTAAGWISLFYMGITFGRFLSGFVTMKLNQQQMIRLGQALIVVGIALSLIPGTKLFLLPALFFIGLGCAPIFPSLLHETPVNFGAENSQAIIGAQMAFAYMGATFMPPVFGFLALKVGYGLFQFFLGGFLIVMIIMVERLHRKAKQDAAMQHLKY
jgi:fucose permease